MPVVVVAVAGRQIDSSHSDTKKCVDSEDRERESGRERGRLESKCGLPKRLRSTAATAALAKKNPSSSLLTVSIQRSNNNNHLTTPRCCSLY